MDLIKIWERCAKFPGGNFIFNRLLRSRIPYSGSVSPQVLALTRGHAQVLLQDKRAHRNHLQSLHAVALMNVAELSSGLAFVTSLPPDARGILTGFSIEYFKKARGPITALAQHPLVESTEKKQYEVEVTLRNAADELVCRARAQWVAGRSDKK